MANKKAANNSISSATTVSHGQVRQPSTIDFAIKHDKR